MNGGVSASEVRLAPGSGRACRRASTVLFVPTLNGDEVIKSFLAAETDPAAVRSVLEHVVAANFSVAPFAIIDWSQNGGRLYVFGDIDVTTSTASARLINGASSKTWVEHTLLDADGVEVVVGDAPIDPLTSLAAGVAHAGAVSIRLRGPVPSAPEPRAPEPRAGVANAPAAPASRIESSAKPPGIAEHRLRLRDGSIIDLAIPVLIGRSPSAQAIGSSIDLRPVAIDDKRLSRNHVVATSTSDGVEILDCGSLNGTRTGPNAESITAIPSGVAAIAAPGSIVEFGAQLAIVESGSEPI